MAANAEATVTLSLIDKVTGPIKRLGARLSALTNKLGFQRISKAASSFGKSIVGLGDGLARTSGRLAAFLGLLGAGGAGAIASAYGLAKSTADIGAEIGETAGKLGIGVEALQEYRYAAKMSGVETAAFDKGVEKLGINAVEAAKGNKQMAAAFKDLGVEVKGAKGEMRSTEDILDDTMLALTKIKDPLKRNALAFKLFGKSGVELTKILADGATGVRELREEARELGFVFSDAATKAGGEFGDNIDRLKIRFEGLRYLIGNNLIPVFNEAIVGINEWAKANIGLIRSTITEWVGKLSRLVRDLIDPTSDVRVAFADLSKTLSNVAGYIKPLIDRFGAMNTALATIALWITGPLLAALAVLGVAFVKLGFAILSTPFGWILAAVAALGAAAYVLYQRWDEFVAYWGDIWTRVKAAFDKGFIQGIITALTEFNPVTHIARGINEVIKYFTSIDLSVYAKVMIESLARGLEAGWAAVSEWISEKMKSITESISGFSTIAYQAGSAIVNSLWDGLKEKWADVVSWFRTSINDLLSFLPESVRSKMGFDISAPKPPEPQNDNGVPNGSWGDNAPRPGDGLPPPGNDNKPAPPGASSYSSSGSPIKDAVAAAAKATDAAASAAKTATEAGSKMGSMFTPAPPKDNGVPNGSWGDNNGAEIVAGDTNVTTSITAPISITVKTDAAPGDIAAAVRRELDGVAKRAASSRGSHLND
ncbi:hypothetical protein RMR21_004385 [Agrobacterium sp. rho-8.1]|nr:hypothetical protein [Agrobacterium sp. rho-8.1]